jgi:hypothetical protein
MMTILVRVLLIVLFSLHPLIVWAQQLTLDWMDNSEGQAGFVIQRSPTMNGPWTTLAQTPAGDTDYVDHAVVWETPYCYRVAATNSQGTSPYSNVACGTAQAPATTAGVTIVKVGMGTVTSTPAGINCGAICSNNFNIGSRVTFTAIAAAGYKFSGWSGWGCSGKGLCKGTITKVGTLWASFTRS